MDESLRVPLVITRGSRRLVVDPPVMAAPMAGVLDPPYRDLLHEHGCPFSTTEMISAKGICEGNPASMMLLSPIPAAGMTAVQIFGSDPELMGRSTSLISGMGYSAVDINAGCPKRKVHAQGAGGALLKDPDLLIEIASSVLENTDLPVGVKLRSGWSEFDPAHFGDILERLSDAGVSYVTIHPRTVAQGFRDRASTDVIREARSFIDVPMIVSGDIVGPRDLNGYYMEGASGYMIGRALMGDPTWFRRCLSYVHGGSFQDRYETSVLRSNLEAARIHARKMVDHYGEQRGIVGFRTHLAWYAKGIRNRNLLHPRINAMKSLNDAYEILKQANELIGDGER